MCIIIISSVLLGAPLALAAESAVKPATRPHLSLVELQRAAGQWRAAVQNFPDPAEVLIPLALAGFVHDPEAAAPTEYLVECRRQQLLAQLAGVYRMDMLYALAFAHSTPQPLAQTLALLNLTPPMAQALTPALPEGTLVVSVLEAAGDAARFSKRLRQGEIKAAEIITVFADADRVGDAMGSLRYLLDMHYAQLLQQTHLVGKLARQVQEIPQPQEVQEEQRLALRQAWRVVGKGINAFRALLYSWTSDPVLVRELGLHRQMNHLDELLLHLEMGKSGDVTHLYSLGLLVDETRADMVARCPAIKHEEEKKRDWKLNPREDLFKPRNFF